MKRARFTQEQIIGILREHEAGAKTADHVRQHGVSEATIYNWKAKFGGMDMSEAWRLKQLEDKNSKLKELLDVAAMRELLAKKRQGPPCSGLRRLPAQHRPDDPLSIQRRQTGILVDVLPILPPDLKLRNLSIPRTDRMDRIWKGHS